MSKGKYALNWHKLQPSLKVCHNINGRNYDIRRKIKCARITLWFESKLSSLKVCHNIYKLKHGICNIYGYTCSSFLHVMIQNDPRPAICGSTQSQESILWTIYVRTKTYFIKFGNEMNFCKNLRYDWYQFYHLDIVHL